MLDYLAIGHLTVDRLATGVAAGGSVSYAATTAVRMGLRAGILAFTVKEVDPTGAGDVFAAAFLIEYNLTGDPRHSTAFACCAASFAVERPGLTGIPDRAAVENRLAAYDG
jgi:sugar/nucleoside kinase (ribokinase family)